MRTFEEDILQFLGDYPETIGATCLELRKLITAEVPGVIEKLYPGWKGIGYTHEAAGYLCGIFPLRDKIKVGFEHGHLLKQHFDKFDHSTRQLKYIIVKDKIPADTIKEVIRDAIAIKAG